LALRHKAYQKDKTIGVFVCGKKSQTTGIPLVEAVLLKIALIVFFPCSYELYESAKGGFIARNMRPQLMALEGWNALNTHKKGTPCF